MRQHYCEPPTQHREAGKRLIRPGQVTCISRTCFYPQFTASSPISIQSSSSIKSLTPSSSFRCDLRYPLPPSPDSKEAMADHHSSGQHHPQNTGHDNSHHPHGNAPRNLHHGYQWPNDQVALDYLSCWVELKCRIKFYYPGYPAPEHGSNPNTRLERFDTKYSKGLDEHSPPAKLARASATFVAIWKNRQELPHGLLPDLDESAKQHLSLPTNVLDPPPGRVLDLDTLQIVRGRITSKYQDAKEGYHGSGY